MDLRPGQTIVDDQRQVQRIVIGIDLYATSMYANEENPWQIDVARGWQNIWNCSILVKTTSALV